MSGYFNPDPEVWDVVVVGAGAAGLAAALEARKTGRSVLVLEKMGSIGGNSALSQGRCSVPNTPVQRNLGVVDSPDLMALDISRVSYVAWPERIRYFVDHALETWEWTRSELGVHWRMDAVDQIKDQSVPRVMQLNPASGMSLMYPLVERCQALGAVVRLNSQTTRLLRTGDEERVVGVRVVAPDEAGKLREHPVLARCGVILATGGFAADHDMVAVQNWRLAQEASTAAQPGATGEMMREAGRIGAFLLHMQYIHCIPECSPDERGLGPAANFNRFCSAPQGMWVVRETGRRFVNEMGWGETITNAMLSVMVRGEKCISLADLHAVEHPESNFLTPQEVDNLVVRGRVLRFDSLAAAARHYEMPLAALEEEITLYNQAVQKKEKRDAWGRPISSRAQPMEAAPWYGCRLIPKVQQCAGGLAIDTEGRVLGVTDDEPMPGLFAAGEVTGGFSGVAHLTECGLMEAMTMGRRAGRTCADAEPQLTPLSETY